MDSDLGDGFFTPPAFKPEQALQTLKRQLRELPGLKERGTQFELSGKPVLALGVEPQQLIVRVAKRLALTPDWDTLTLKNSADLGKCVAEIKKRLARWDDEP